MNTPRLLLAVGAVLSFVFTSFATTLYVDPNCASPVSPYSDWSSAATNIQDAIDAAVDGDIVLVTNGVYASGGRPVYGSLTNRVVIDKAITVQSFNGPSVTIIQGNPVLDDTAVRCVYLTNGAALIGFTLTQGGTRNFQGDMYLEWRGGGAYCESTNAMISNCVFSANSAANGGGGIIGGTLESCILSNNSTTMNYLGGNGGGGALASTLNHCLLVGNSGYADGGGADSCMLSFCTLIGNSAGGYGGGATGSTLNECILTNNSAGNGGGATVFSDMNNCDVVGNAAYFAGGSYGGTVNNCIIYYNQSVDPYYPNTYDCALNRCCTFPHAGTGNFTNEPAFVNFAAGDFHLQSTSFCINAGDNGTVVTTLDADGNPRIVGPYVDVGVFEYQSVASLPLSANVFADYTNVATGFTVNLTGEIGGHETLSFWDLGDGTLVTNQLNLSHSWSAVGDYVVTLTAYDADHPAGVSASLTVHTLANPTYYVALENPTPAAPYNSWSTAANSIQDAVDAAFAGGVVWVSNGVYQTGGRIATGATSNRVSVTAPIKIQSVNGPAVSIIQGYTPPSTNGPDSVRCVYLSNGASLSGFTLTNGSTYSDAGGGALVNNGSISNCVLVGNSAKTYGGGALGNLLDHCVIKGNRAQNGGGFAGAKLINCLVLSNTASASGGGLFTASATNCTIVGNYAAVSGGGTYQGTLRNSIIYFNSIGSANATATNTSGSSVSYCCTKPLVSGIGNITNDPAFANPAAADFHLQAVSPCLNAGTNVFASDATDLDSNPRVMFGNVDLGAYEFQTQIRYVAISNATPLSPYTNWMTAATNIQDAIDVANAGEFVIVSNGIYNSGGRVIYGALTNRVVLNKAVTVQSVNGPAATMIRGNPAKGSAAIRCVYLTNNASLIGFTLAYGATLTSGDALKEASGAGAWCESLSAVLSGCVLVTNQATLYGGGCFSGTLTNCVLTNNTAGYGGGASSNILKNCALQNNAAGQYGGAAYGASLYNCALVTNVALHGGGSYQSELFGCSLTNNRATSGLGGGSYGDRLTNCVLFGNWAYNAGGGAYQSVLYSCNITSNSLGQTFYAGGGMSGGSAFNCLLRGNLGGANNSTLYNCTIVQNSNVLGGGISGGVLYNCIVYYNSAQTGSNWSGGVMTNCCTMPLPSGSGNFTNTPVFVDLLQGDFRLQSNSPCINSGANSFATNLPVDLDALPRIAGNLVDVGAYEFQAPASVLPYSWLWQYNLAINGASDSGDPDGDGMSNWQEWRSGTSPTNSTSLLKVNSVVPTNDFSRATVTWQSVAGKTYFIDRAGDLATQPAFSTIQSNIVGQAGTTSYTDTNAVGGGPFFYRVGVQ